MSIGGGPSGPSGRDELRAEVTELVARAGVTTNLDLIESMVETAIELGQGNADRLDLKIARAALVEMSEAFEMFAPYDNVPKVTIFGSARVIETQPLWELTRSVAASLAEQGWMVVTGAGPGIMQAGMEGAGAARSIGVRIRLPFESGANEVIARDPKLVTMRYFFTRKLMLVKESSAFVCMPGGFGTLDETLELLTLQQTGKGVPTPIVLLDVKGGTYWHGFDRFIRQELMSRGMVSSDDLDRVLMTDSVDATRDEILTFWRNYHSLRWVGDVLVLRLRSAPTPTEVAELDRTFNWMCTSGHIQVSGPLGPERAGHDVEHLPRITLKLDQRHVGSLHKLIRAINALPSAPPLTGDSSPAQAEVTESGNGRGVR